MASTPSEPAPDEAAEALEAHAAQPAADAASERGEGAPPVDEAAESAFLAEARQRGETFSGPAEAEEPEPANGKNLPPLNELVAQIPAEVRETLDELFRAKFVTVRRLPKQALKA